MEKRRKKETKNEKQTKSSNNSVDFGFTRKITHDIQGLLLLLETVPTNKSTILRIFFRNVSVPKENQPPNSGDFVFERKSDFFGRIKKPTFYQ